MIKHSSRRATAGAFLSLSCLVATPAQALSFVTFVSGKGTDSGTCASAATPCRTFQFAVNQTSPAGELKALDPAHYGAVVITKSLSITGVEGASRILNIAKDAITINAGPNDVVNLSRLTLDGVKVASHGIVLNSAGSLTVTDCVVRNFTSTAILLQPSGAAKFLIGDTQVSNNSGFAVSVVPQGKGSAIGTLNHVSFTKNSVGITIDGFNGGVDVTAIHSIATNNSGTGFATQGKFAVLRLAHSTATNNGNGVAIGTGSTAESFGDNDIHGNQTNDVQGTLTPVATR